MLVESVIVNELTIYAIANKITKEKSRSTGKKGKIQQCTRF